MGCVLFLMAAIAVVAAGFAGASAFAWSGASEDGKAAARAALADARRFYGAVWFFVRGGDYSACPGFGSGSGNSGSGNSGSGSDTTRRAKVQVFGLCLVLRLWSQPHYRNGSFQEDMKKNLRNVAVPGTGLPLSLFAYHRLLWWAFLFVFYPVGCLVAALHVGRRDLALVSGTFREQLLTPSDWFSLWRLNCGLASYHALLTKEEQYGLEDKFSFLKEAEAKGVAVSPFMSSPAAIVCKDRNEEGGMGIHFFRNAVHGGDWILQEVLTNAEPIKSLLPDKAPLSTFRVITMSSCGANTVRPLSCVWRAGLQGASTDHSAVLFDVDSEAEKFRPGSSNGHWYRLGPKSVLTTPWTAGAGIGAHPDTGTEIAGRSINAKEIMAFAASAHEAMIKKVPIAGWDVALTEKGMLMLEVNLSCNFFGGSFDQDAYFAAVDKYFTHLETVVKTQNQ